MEYSFKNGITVSIPDDMPKETQLENWTAVKMAMSLLLDPPEAEEPKVRKPYTFKDRSLSQIQRRTKSWHKQKK